MRAFLGVPVLLVSAVLLAALVIFSDRPLLVVQQLLFPLQALLIGRVGPRDYAVRSLPTDLSLLLNSYLDAKRRAPVGGYLEFGNGSNTSPEDHILFGATALVPLGRRQKAAIAVAMRPMMEQFCACKLEAPQVHGIRVYRKGSSLVWHLDWPDTWVVSATIHLRTVPSGGGTSDGSETAWPFALRSGLEWLRGANETMVYHGEGEALLYEGSRLWHGRPEPFQGEEYSAVFVGFVPEQYPRDAVFSVRLIVQLVRAFKGVFLGA